MKKWEKALNQFLDKYKSKTFVEGVLLCGSYATGNQNKYSDIDVHILLNDAQNWRERGYVSQDGFLIEYFMNPIKKIRQEFRDDYSNGGNATANMFAYGQILFDRKGAVKQLKSEAVKFLKKTPRKWKKKELEMDLYGVWNLMDELNGLEQDKRFLNIVYYELLKALSVLYFKVNGIPKISLTKMEKLLADSEFAKKYHIQKVPDKRFVKLFLSAIYKIDVSKIRKLYNFVMESLGGFDVSKFKMRSKL